MQQRLLYTTALTLALTAVGLAAYETNRRSPAAVVAVPSEPAEGVLAVEPAVRDLGERLRTDPVVETFRITNGTRLAVDFGEPVKGCSCSEVVVSAPRLEPGGSCDVRMAWNLSGKRGRTSEAVILPVTFTGGTTDYLRMKLVAKVVGQINADCEVIALDRTKMLKQTVKLIPAAGVVAKIVGVTASHPGLTARVTGELEFEVEIDPTKDLWEFGDLFVVAVTDSAGEREVRVPVRIAK